MSTRQTRATLVLLMVSALGCSTPDQNNSTSVPPPKQEPRTGGMSGAGASLTASSERKAATSGCLVITYCAYKDKRSGSILHYTVEGTECSGCRDAPIYKDNDGDKNFVIDPTVEPCHSGNSPECGNAGDKPNWREVDQHRRTCAEPPPTGNYQQCLDHCGRVDYATESCPKECHGDQSCVGSCGGVCKGGNGCRDACNDAENRRKDQWASDAADACARSLPADKQNNEDCHENCNNVWQPSHDECVRRCDGRAGCESMCHSRCDMQGCRNNCNALPHKKVKGRPEFPHEGPRGGRN